MLRLVLACLALCFSYNIALAKYCVKLPSCEELGYVFPYKEGRRQIRCPFDTDKALYLDYCQAYGIQGKPDETAGEYQECIEEKADGTKINTGYYRYTRCNVGYRYESGHCVRYSCNTPHTCLVGDVYLHDNKPIGVVFYDDGTITKIVALNDVNANGEDSENASMYWSTSSDGTYSYTTNNTYYNIETEALADINGKNNTANILATRKPSTAATATNLYSPSVCANGTFCGKGEWYLPALGELNIIHKNKSTIQTTIDNIGGVQFSYNHYWSSSEYNLSYVWIFSFGSGYKTYYDKYYTRNVRPVLAF